MKKEERGKGKEERSKKEERESAKGVLHLRCGRPAGGAHDTREPAFARGVRIARSRKYLRTCTPVHCFPCSKDTFVLAADDQFLIGGTSGASEGFYALFGAKKRSKKTSTLGMFGTAKKLVYFKKRCFLTLNHELRRFLSLLQTCCTGAVVF